MLTTQQLIEEASQRLLTLKEKAALARGLFKGNADEFRRLVNRAYALAKQYDCEGGAPLLQELDHLFLTLGSSDFKILYEAAKLP